METIVFLDPVVEPSTSGPPDETPPPLGLVEWMLKDQRRLDACIRDEHQAPDLIPRLLTVALAGFILFGVTATVIVNLAGTSPSWMPPAWWSDGTWASLTLAYDPGPCRGHRDLFAQLLLLWAPRRREAVDASSRCPRRQVPGRHRHGPGRGSAGLCGPGPGDDRLLGPFGVDAIDDRPGPGRWPFPSRASGASGLCSWDSRAWATHSPTAAASAASASCAG